MVAKRLIQSKIRDEVKLEMLDSLNSIGWTITDDGNLATQDVLLSEQFFSPGTYHDAYVAIRDILAKAVSIIVVVDAYMGNSLFTTLSGLPACAGSVQLLTTDKAIKPDFNLEASAFQKQFPHIKLEVRTTKDFHDRFIMIDGNECYHVGASIKDAGKRAFLISRLQDTPIVDAVQRSFSAAWTAANVVI